MRRTLILVVFVPILSYADASLDKQRDAALKAINACLQRNEVSSRECKHLNENVEALVHVYRQGDKTVLPMLFKFTYLTDFYGEALLGDPRGFLSEMGRLSEKDQKAVAAGLAGGMFRIRSKERFEALRTLLRAIPDSEPIKTAAEVCLRAVERQNASFFVTYFPPQTFTNPAADFEIHWYSAEMYALGEEPLWPPSAEHEIIYRLTYLPAFTGPSVITLTVSPGGERRIAIRTMGRDREVVKVNETSALSEDQAAQFFSLLDHAHFWESPTKLPMRGLGEDGAEWIMEGVKDGKYRVVDRWCPNVEGRTADEIRFGEAGGMLFKLAGQKHDGC